MARILYDMTIAFFLICIYIALLVYAVCKSASSYDYIYDSVLEKELNNKELHTYSTEEEKDMILAESRPVVEKIKIKYFSDEIDKIEKMEYGNWIDLRAAEEVRLDPGEFKLISLGIGMKLPEGYEAHVAPRSSTFKNFGIIQTNSVAVIDNSYSGDNDCWFYPVYALRTTNIHVNDRICQFRIVKEMPVVKFEEVEHLDDKNRGGHGSTGVQ